MTSKRQNQKSTKTVKKMAMLAGSMAAVGTMQANSQAAIQHTDATASPIGLSMMNDGDGATQGWDIDGDSSNDAMWSVTTSMTSSEEEVDHGKVLIGGGPLFVATDGNDLTRLTSSATVGPNLLGQGSIGNGTVLSYDYNVSSDIQLGGIAEDLNWGDNYIGFQFEKDGNTHYGWANLNLNQGTGTAAFTEWAWEDTPGADIHVPDTSTPQGGGAVGDAPVVPEPSSLALLALGAGGLFTYRARQKKLSADQSAEVTA